MLLTEKEIHSAVAFIYYRYIPTGAGVDFPFGMLHTTLPATPTQRTSHLRTVRFTARLEILYRCTEELNMSLFCTVLYEEFGERVTLSKLTPQSSVDDALIVRSDDGEYMCLWASNGTPIKREAGDKLHSFDPHNKHNIEHLLTCYTLHRKRKEAEKCSRSTSRQH